AKTTNEPFRRSNGPTIAWANGSFQRRRACARRIACPKATRSETRKPRAYSSVSGPGRRTATTSRPRRRGLGSLGQDTQARIDRATPLAAGLSRRRAPDYHGAGGGMDDARSAQRLVLTFSPLPQHAWSQERDLANDEQAIRSLRAWGEHLARAIRTA